MPPSPLPLLCLILFASLIASKETIDVPQTELAETRMFPPNLNPSLLKNIGNFLPGTPNMGDLKTELQDMLFGGKSPPPAPPSQPPRVGPPPSKPEDVPSRGPPLGNVSRVVDGDRADYLEYDYKDYDVYSYPEYEYEDDDDDDLKFLEYDYENGTIASVEEQEPMAAEQRQSPVFARRPGLNPRLLNQRRRALMEKKLQMLEERRRKEKQRKDEVLDDSLSSPTFNIRLPIKKGADCDYYTDDLCLQVRDYPRDQIVSLLNGNRREGSNLIAEVRDQSADQLVDGVSSAQENQYTFAHYFGNRREDGSHLHRDFAEEGGFLCPSEIKYAKPKRGKTAQGVWKDIVNVNDYTQTLRMEKCLKPGGTCSYVSHHYKSQCSQVYNYHRLLSWDKERGLHMDIYKVPTCCSCHIMGYSYVYPPLKTGGGYSGSRPHAQNLPPPQGGVKKRVPDFNPKKEFENFMTNIASKFPGPFGNNKDAFGRPSLKKNVIVESPGKQTNSAPPPVRSRGPRPPFRRRIVPERDPPRRRADFEISKRRDPSPPQSRPVETSSPVKKDESSVNYGYHPIIDFMGNYRFDSA